MSFCLFPSAPLSPLAASFRRVPTSLSPSAEFPVSDSSKQATTEASFSKTQRCEKPKTVDLLLLPK